jgi:hypothetical protein
MQTAHAEALAFNASKHTTASVERPTPNAQRSTPNKTGRVKREPLGVGRWTLGVGRCIGQCTKLRDFLKNQTP